MSVVGYSVRNRVTMTMFYTLVIAFGIFSFARLQIDLYPDMDIPYIVAITTYIGASPADIETLISRRMEESAVSVTGIKNVMSTSRENVSIVMLEFPWGYDMDKAETDTRRRLEMVRGRLPDDAMEPLIVALDPSMQPVVMFNLIGDYSVAELRRIAEDRIKPRLERVEGISAVDVAGGELREIHVKLDPTKLEAFRISPTTIVQMVGAENMQSVGGYIETSFGMDFNIQTTGKYRSVEEIGEILLGMAQDPRGALIPIRLRDVAEIEDTFEESRRIIETDGKSSLMMLARKQSGANTVDAANGILAVLPIVLAGEIGLDYRIIFNQGEFIQSSIGNLLQTTIIAIGIVFLVLLLFFRSIRTSLIVSTAIPMSLMATFAVMSQIGMSMNVISMAGLALSVGMLVDNAIVVLENIFRLREAGHSAFQSCVRGTKEVMMAILASTLTTVAVFLPILFVEGIMGIMFRDMALVVCISLTVSYIVAITFVPMLSYYLLRSKRYERMAAEKTLEGGAEATRVRPSFTTSMRLGYERLLRLMLRKRLIVTVVIGALFGASLYGFKLVPMDFMAGTDNSMVNVTITTEIGNSVSETFRVVQECVDRVKEVVPETDRRQLTIDVGSSSSGMGALFSAGGVHTGRIRLPLVKPRFRDRHVNQIVDELREALRDVPGITYQVSSGDGFGGGGADIEIEVYNDDIQMTRKITNRIRLAALERDDISEITLSMEEQKPQIQVQFDREKMSQLGLTTGMVGNLITIFFRGVTASYFLEGGDEYDIVVRYDRDFRHDIKSIESMPLMTNTGAIIPLSTVAKVGENLAPTAIERKNQKRYQKVSLTLKNTFEDANGRTVKKDLQRSITEITAILDKMVQEDRGTPSEWYYAIAGTADDFMTSMKYLLVALLVSVLLVYMVMASQFENYSGPFIVLFSVPLGIIGMVAAFLITGRTLDMAGLIGLAMLVAIVVNNAIVMVDAANQNREKGMDRVEAIVNAAYTRLRPVLMTAISTILAMVPLAMQIGEGAETWSGMGLAVLGGLTASTMFTLFFVPVMYTVFAPKKFEIPEYEEEFERHQLVKRQVSNDIAQ
ncbi:MAG: efflux RND transporter permease subunit [Proteobacteria bacterium]|nr:efflux RND transporter permease subunit [Pseudomonadota bacterium]